MVKVYIPSAQLHSQTLETLEMAEERSPESPYIVKSPQYIWFYLHQTAASQEKWEKGSKQMEWEAQENRAVYQMWRRL